MPKEIPFLDWNAIDEELGKKNAQAFDDYAARHPILTPEEYEAKYGHLDDLTETEDDEEEDEA